MMDCEEDGLAMRHTLDGGNNHSSGSYGHASSGTIGRMVPTPAAASHYYMGQGLASSVGTGSGSGAMNMMPHSYLPGVMAHSQAMAAVAQSFELKTERKLFLPFLEQLLDDEAIDGLHWIDRDKRIFRMPWKHMKRHDYIQEKDAALFKAWAINSGKYKENDPDPSRWKINFRSALNTMKHVFVEILDENVDRDDCRIFRIAVPPTETTAANRKRRANLVPVLAQRHVSPAPIKPCPVTTPMKSFGDINASNGAAEQGIPPWHAQPPVAHPAAPPGWMPGVMPSHPGQGMSHWGMPAGMAGPQPGIPWQSPAMIPQQHIQMAQMQSMMRPEKAEFQDSIEMAKAQYDLIDVADADEPTCLEGIFSVIYKGKVSNVKLQIILHASFPQQPPDIIVSGHPLDMVQRCESLLQQLEYNTYWSPKGHTLLGFLDAISCDLEKHDLSDIRSTVPENSTTVSVFKPGTEEKYLEDGDNGDDDPSLADMPHLTSSTRGENGSHEAASRFPQQNDKRKPSAFQPYRKRPHENGSGAASPKRLRPSSPMTQMHVPSPLTRSDTPNGKPSQDGNSEVTASANSGKTDVPSGFASLGEYTQHLEIQIQQKNGAIMEYMMRIRELETHTKEMQCALQHQSFELAEVHGHLQVKADQVEKLETQLSVSKYYLSSAQQKLSKASYLTRLNRDDREIVDIRIHQQPQPAAAAPSLSEGVQDTVDSSSNNRHEPQASEHGVKKENSNSNAKHDRLSPTANFEVIDPPPNLIPGVPECSNMSKSAAVQGYESKCVPWEGFSSSSSRASSPSDLVVDTSVNTDTAVEKTCLGDVYIENDVAIVQISPPSDNDRGDVRLQACSATSPARASA